MNDALSLRDVRGAAVALGAVALVCLAGCRIDHYALVRVSVRDVDTGELVTNGTCNVTCKYRSFSLLRGIMLAGQRSDYHFKTIGPDDGGVAWFWGHGDADDAWTELRDPPIGYYHTKINSADRRVGFSWLMTYVPIPLHMPPFRNATVYVRRQFDPIDAEVRPIGEVSGPVSNGVSLATYRPVEWKGPVLTNDYAFTAGYDCMKGDYCPPFGKGEVADILFDHSYVYRGVSTNRWGRLEYDYVKKRTMRFPGKGNGFVFRDLPRPTAETGREFAKDDFLAPLDGYGKEDECWYGAHNASKNRFADCVDFRIRSRYDEKGTLTSCHYGRFRGRYDYSSGLSGFFYVNPRPLDRNLEIVNGKEYCGKVWRW